MTSGITGVLGMGSNGGGGAEPHSPSSNTKQASLNKQTSLRKNAHRNRIKDIVVD